MSLKNMGNFERLSVESLEDRKFCAVDISGPLARTENLDVPVLSWYNGRDRQLDIVHSLFYADGRIDRREAINLLKSTRTDGVIRESEFISLTEIFDNSEMPDYVRYLGSSVVDGSSSNTHFQGKPLGNLSPGSSAEHMQKLIDKWFLGKDYPETGTSPEQNITYNLVRGDLFVDGVSGEDIAQGKVGNCYLMNALMSLSSAEIDNSAIEKMFLDNNDGTWTVRFYDIKNNYVPHYVTVDRYLPTRSNRDSWFADFGSDYLEEENELWPALAEKAYVQFSTQIDGIRNVTTKNNYQSTDGGITRDTIKSIVGHLIPWRKLDNKEQIIADLEHGYVFTISFSNHGWTITDYDRESDKFFIRNPWGYNHIEETWEDMGERGLHFKWIYKVSSVNTDHIEDYRSKIVFGNVAWLV